jgi:hypothetical protein
LRIEGGQGKERPFTAHFDQGVKKEAWESAALLDLSNDRFDDSLS